MAVETKAAGPALPTALTKRQLSWGHSEVSPGVCFGGPDQTEFRVGDLLGHGTFAKVYKCRRLSTDEECAVKAVSLTKLMFLPDFLDQEKMLDREVQILKRLRHHRIVNLHDFYKTEHHWFLVMELVCGGELFHNIPPNRGLGEYEAAYIFIQLLEGIGYIHSQGVLHRDLKPENILIVSSRPANPPATGKLRDVKIADFGLGKVGDGSASPARSCVGSPVYVAPEVLLVGKQGGSYDRAVDLWSLGAVLFVMLCGLYPFDGKSAPREVVLGAIARLRGCVGSRVDMVELHLADGSLRTYGSGDSSPRGPWELASDERIVAAMQEQQPQQDCLGNSLVFLTSAGRFLELDGANAKRVHRFAAQQGTQITGLVFEGSVLTGINVLPISRTRLDTGVVQEIRAWAGAAVDGVELRFRDGSVVSYGGTGGSSLPPFMLKPDELIVAVVQTYHESYLGASIAFITSAGRVLEVNGSKAGPVSRFAVPAGEQIDRLIFEGSLLKDVQQVPPEKQKRTANFKMESPQWQKLSEEAKNLIRGLLQVDPVNRFRLECCYSQPWITNTGLPLPEPEFTEFVKKGSNPEIIASAAAIAALSSIDEESAGSPEGWREEESSDPTALAHISARLASAVDRLELRPRFGATLVYGGHGGEPAGPWTLQPREYVIAVDQETRGCKFGYLGNAIAFYTSLGNIIAIAGSHACGFSRFAAPLGSQVTGLRFEGSRLVGIQQAPAQTTDAQGVVAEISGRAGSAVDWVQLRLRGGQTAEYGNSGGGHPRGSWTLKPEELIVAVAQEHRDAYLGNSLLFFTSHGQVLAINGTDARQRQCFAAPSGHHIAGLHFDGSTLAEAKVEPVAGSTVE